MSFVALGYYFQENYEEALHYSQMAVRARAPYIAIRALLATLGQLGRADEAKAVLEQFKSREPNDVSRHFHITTPYRDSKHREHLLEGLRRAGVRGL